MTQTALSLIHTDQPKKWQEILSDLITDPKELVQVLQLDLALKPASLAAMEQFPLKVTRPFVAAIEPGNWQDPLLLQIWPSQAEEAVITGFVADPLLESDANPVPGLLHKYHGRVLLTAVRHCAIHCRYCFRRHFPYHQHSIDCNSVLKYLKQHPDIDEIIENFKISAQDKAQTVFIHEKNPVESRAGGVTIPIAKHIGSGAGASSRDLARKESLG